MTVFQTIAALLTAAALAGYINQRWFKLPTTIALMGFSLILSAGGIALNHAGIIDLHEVNDFISTINFSSVVLNGMLSLLLFAGAMQFDLTELQHVRYSVVLLATLGVLISTFVTGGLLWWAASFLGFHLPLIYALLFGALIAPTDPIAVLSLLKKAQLPKRLYAGIAGESLLNDGISIVLFLAFLGVATQAQEFNLLVMGRDLFWNVAGGAILGAGLGFVTFYCLQSIDDYKVEILLTLALASGGYVLAGLLETSGPIVVAVSGLVIGSQGQLRGSFAVTRKHLYLFWELLDEILNAILFLLMGFVLMIVSIQAQHLLLGVIAIPTLLTARLISVGLPISFIRMFRSVERGTVRLLTWGGLRGGISIALALSLPVVPERDPLLTMTYVVVVFSILGQGLTFPRLVRFFQKKNG